MIAISFMIAVAISVGMLIWYRQSEKTPFDQIAVVAVIFLAFLKVYQQLPDHYFSNAWDDAVDRVKSEFKTERDLSKIDLSTFERVEK